MSFKPCNRHLLVKEEATEIEEAKATILVPDSYQTKTSPHGVYKVVALASDCTKVEAGMLNKKVLVNNGMVEEVSIDGEKLLLVLENHVYGVFE